MNGEFISKLLVIISLFSMSLVVYADPPLPTPVGRVVWIKGTLTATMPSNEERKLQKQSVIYLKDTLSTDAESQAQIVFTDDTLITFEKNTKFVVEQYQYAAKKKSVGSSVMNLLQGGFRTITGIIAKKSPNAYAVNTPVATIGVRGTDYVVHFENNELFMGHYDGKPCMKNEKGALCMDDKNKYGKIGLNLAPVVLAEQPIFFKEKLTIEPAHIEPFVSPLAPAAAKAAPAAASGKRSGNSFCVL